jgi:pilus assembly protein CpaC
LMVRLNARVGYFALTLALSWGVGLSLWPAGLVHAASPKAATRAPAGPLAQAASAWPKSVNAVVGHVLVLRLPQPVSRVVVGDPQVADYRLISRNELYVLGNSVGTTNLVLWQSGGQPVSLTVNVGADLTPLADSLKLALPLETDIQLMMASGSVVLSGTVNHIEAVDSAMSLAQAYARQLNRYLGGAAGSPVAAAGAAPAPAATAAAATASPAAGSGQGTQVINLLQVRDDQRLTPLSTSLRQALPLEQAIELKLASGSVVLGGSVSNTLAADAVLGLTEAYLRRSGGVSAGPSRIVNLLRVRDAQQVMLDVRIAEVSKTLLDKLGLKVQAAGGGDVRWNVLSSFLGGGNASAGLLFRNGNTINLDAEKRDGLVRILAEPTIVAMSGQEGSFLVGGKVFIPITQSSGAAGSAVTLQEREFGVGLKFVPTVLDGGRISLKVAPEVSEISRESVSAGTGDGSTLLPAFTTRRVSTTVQLQDGQSLVIGGLLRNNSSASSNAFPFLGELPIIGALFRSSQYAADLTELVVVVRASLVQATDAAPALPTDTVTTPSRPEFFMERRLQGRPPASDAEMQRAP